MFYNPHQFNKDLSLIVSVFGERRQRGFFTEGVYEDNDIIIVDPYTIEPRLYWNKTHIKEDNVKINGHIAQYVMEKALKAEEMRNY